ncbi:hypothetical protein V8E54_008086 [Elaphomyces granulatus]
MLNRELPIRCHEDILWSTGLENSGLGGYLILTAINSVYPIALTKIYHGAEARRPSMPQLDILPYISRTEHMGAILEDEATVIGVGKYFPKAAGLDEQSAFQEQVYLVYGD